MNKLENSFGLSSQSIALRVAADQQYPQILTKEALDFLATLQRRFDARRRELLEARASRQEQIDAGQLPDFNPHTEDVRNGDWKVASLPTDLLDRRVEITGPVDRKMIINALNSGAKVFMADLEDSNSPTWTNCMEGQINLYDAVRRQIEFKHPITGKEYKLNDDPAVLMVRPRGWHLEENNLMIDGMPMSASLFDFGLYFFHNARQLLENGSGPYFYLPKLESHLEARLWNDVFVYAQDYLGIEQRSIKATVLVETIMASFELHEILYELRDHSAGLNCGRWDYIFSYIKRLKMHADYVLPDRALVSMQVPFMKAYSKAVIEACHKRGVHAMGGMAAFIPIKGDEAANDAALAKVHADKLNEVLNGHDGTWVAHPGLVKPVLEIFNEHMPTPNQIFKREEGFELKAEELLVASEGAITEQGLKTNINVGILYIESWLMGQGAAALYNLMEDAATAEISRTQVWQWLQHEAKLDDGRTITQALVDRLITAEMDQIRSYIGAERYDRGRFDEARQLFEKLIFHDQCEEFLTLEAYKYI
jgi:malate synthase